MAGEQQQPANQYERIYTLGVQSGIKRDGTTFESREYSDGVWCRFQRGVPKKMGGYQQLFSSFNGITRGMIMNSYNGVNYIFAGNANGLDVFATGQTFGIGSGPYEGQLEVGYSEFTITSVATNQFVIPTSPPEDLTSLFPNGTKLVFAQSTTPTFYTVTAQSYNSGTGDNTITVSATITGSPTSVWIADSYFAPNAKALWQFDFQYSPQDGSLNLLAHPGLNLENIDNGTDTPVYVGSTTPNSSEQWTFTVLADTTGTAPTYKPIVVSGGVCVLHPFIFVYGDNGFIANNNVSSIYLDQNLTDWNGPLANQVNVASGKIVKGMPIRGGTSAPSGLFWATDSLIRVSFVNNPPTYWQYDIVSSQTSIMSSSSVVEMDGVYYWMGVDRFYLYNGVVQVLPNDKNVNWLFDNLNYEQRQKVWATKVPRYNEIWFFYPRGTATECTDAIIYNVKDKIWYDAGQAVGAQRSSGYTTEIFPTPIWADWNYDVLYSQGYQTIAQPTGQPAVSTTNIYFSGDVTPTFQPAGYITLSTNVDDPKYQIDTADFIFNTTIGGAGVTRVTLYDALPAVPDTGTYVYNITGGYGIWQHEIGLNKITTKAEEAVYSSFTTCDLSWVGGTPSEDTAIGVNRRMHLRRIEPDFIQGGMMTMNVLGRKFARGPVEDSGPFSFDENTEKIDLRIEHRELRLQFVSNTINGNYEMGRLLITAEFGDERP